MSSTPTTAVIIVAWQDEPGLDACLESLTTQLQEAFEVIVADNGAGLSARLDPWSKRLNLRHVDMGANVGVCKARNAAVAATTAELLMFLDDDAIAVPGWIGAFQELMATTDAVAARGRVQTKSEGILNELARAYDLGETVRPAIINTEGNCAVRSDVYRELGGFNDEMYGHEGAELSTRILAHAGGRDDAILYCPDAVILHDYVDNIAGYVRKRYRHGLMVRHLDIGATRKAASKSIRRSPWTLRRVALIPVKVLGIAAEVAGLAVGRRG